VVGSRQKSQGVTLHIQIDACIPNLAIETM
jgi:hypothetical protein